MLEFHAADGATVRFDPHRVESVRPEKEGVVLRMIDGARLAVRESYGVVLEQLARQ